MKSLILILAVAWASIAQASTSVLVNPYRFAAAYLVNENMEGTGTPAGWTVTTAGGNFDYTTTVLAGAQSYSADDLGNVYVDFTATADVWVYFKLRVTSTDDNITILALQDASSNELARVFQPSTFHRFRLYHGATSATSGDNELPQNTLRHVWMHYVKGTGSNSTADLFWSGTGTKPGSPQLTLTGENETANASRVRFSPSVGATIKILDDLKVSATEIGNQ